MGRRFRDDPPGWQEDLQARPIQGEHMAIEERGPMPRADVRYVGLPAGVISILAGRKAVAGTSGASPVSDRSTETGPRRRAKIIEWPRMRA